jgi:hypothetical protein
VTNFYGRKRAKPKHNPKDDIVDESKLSRILAEKERLVDLEMVAELADPDVIYIVGAPHPPRPKIDRTLYKQLYAELSMAERVEFAFRCRARAREAWERGDNELKWKWGGY